MEKLSGQVIDFNWEEVNLNYQGLNKYVSFSDISSNIHAYPAKAVPEMVNDLLKILKQQYSTNSVLDPFLGSGTTALEAKLLEIDFYGSDLNPLAILLAKTKIINLSSIVDFELYLHELKNKISEIKFLSESEFILTTFKNIDYWFKPENILELSKIKSEISKFLNNLPEDKVEPFALILLTAFSSTIKESSLSRNGEFKLYRMLNKDIQNFNPNSYELFQKNLDKVVNYLIEINRYVADNSITKVYLEDAKKLQYMNQVKVDLVLTSPPYGDSRSTVAYGQFSRLSLQWISDLLINYLNIEVVEQNCDELLLGGKLSESITKESEVINKSKTLQKLVQDIDETIMNETRELEVLNNLTKEYIRMLEVDKKILKLIENTDLEKIIIERIRLNLYREINNMGNLNKVEAKKLALKSAENFYERFFINSMDLTEEQQDEIRNILFSVYKSFERKKKALPKRKPEILNFFIDLYEVILRTDQVLNSKGIQAWIMGNRTVLKTININLKEIVFDFLIGLDYEKVTDLSRDYSFKRLPHHINSSLNREDKITTMMHEYILIMKKS